MINSHGSYIHDFRGTRVVREVSLEEANRLIEQAGFELKYPDGMGHYMCNKNFIVTGAQDGENGPEAVVLYNHDGNYRIVSVPIQSLANTFIERPRVIAKLKELGFSV